MTQFNPKIRIDSNPEQLWDSAQVNNELTSIDNAISSLDGILLSTIGTQIVNGQKTFFNLYLDSDGIETYESIMETNKSDISPVFGAGNITLEYNGIPEEGGYLKHNVSGFTTTLVPLNPCFLHGDITIRSAGTSTEDKRLINIQTGNIPLISYDTNYGGTPPNLNTINLYSYDTSNTISDISGLSGTCGTSLDGTVTYYGADNANGMNNILILANNRETGVLYLLIVHPDYISTISKEFNSFRKLGFMYVLPSGPVTGETFINTRDTLFMIDSNNLSATNIYASNNRTGISGILTCSEASNIQNIKSYIIFQGFTEYLYSNLPIGTKTSNTGNFLCDVNLGRVLFKLPINHDSNGDISSELISPLKANITIYSFNHGDIIL